MSIQDKMKKKRWMNAIPWNVRNILDDSKLEAVQRNEEIASVCALRVSGSVVPKPEWRQLKIWVTGLYKTDMYCIYYLLPISITLDEFRTISWTGKVPPCCYRLAHTPHDRKWWHIELTNCCATTLTTSICWLSPNFKFFLNRIISLQNIESNFTMLPKYSKISETRGPWNLPSHYTNLGVRGFNGASKLPWTITSFAQLWQMLFFFSTISSSNTW